MMKQLKCDGFGKLLKPLLSTLLISCFILLGNFSNGTLCPVAYNRTPLYTFNLNEETLINDRQSNSNFTLKSNFNFLVDNSNYNGKFFFSNNPWANSYSLQTYLFWTLDGLYYAYGGSSSPSDLSSNVLGQGYINYFCKVDSLDGFCRIDNFNSCTSVQGYSLVSSGNVYSSSDYSNPDIMKVFATSNTMVNFCFVYTDLGFTLCAPVGTNSICDSSNSCVLYSSNLLTPTNSINPISIDTSVMTSSPFGSSSDGGDDSLSSGRFPNGGIELGSKYSAINYFESKYGFDSNICFVGVDNMTSQWGSSVSFQAGTGLTIFQAYDSLYGNSNLNRVYVWINNWLINHQQWFGTNGNPLFLSNYNFVTNQVDIYYDNLSFPFNNNPVGVYFMSDNIVNYSNRSIYGDEIDGGDVVDYCNLKINNGDFEDILNSNIRENINNYTENENTGKGLNPDGTDYIMSGANEYFSGTSFQDLYETMFGNFKHAFNVDSSNSNNNGILPGYIIFAFLLYLLYYGLKR